MYEDYLSFQIGTPGKYYLYLNDKHGKYSIFVGNDLLKSQGRAIAYNSFLFMLFNNPEIETPNRHLPSTMLNPGGEDDNEDMDWSDIDDEDFEDMAEDKDDYHQIQLDNNLFDPEDDDHLPEDDD